MSLFDALNVGLTGLNVASAGLLVTEHNVANVSVSGFTRRSAEIATAYPVRRGVHWIGQGVSLARIARGADAFAFRRLVGTTGAASFAVAKQVVFDGVEGLFESESASLRGDIDALFDAFGAATADPSDESLRHDVVSAAEAFAATVNSISSGMLAQVDSVDQEVAASVAAVNADLALVASLNQQIASSGGTLAAGDLADTRDQALTRLADAIGAAAFYERDGTVTVRIGGHAAVSGFTAREVDYDPRRTSLTLSVDEGAVSITDDVGGHIGGQLSAREALSSWMQELSTLVIGLGTALNTQNAAGFTSGGVAGGDIFTFGTGSSAAIELSVDPAFLADPGLLAFAASSTAEAGDNGNLLAFLDLENADLPSGTTAGNAASDLTSKVGSAVSLANTQATVAVAAMEDAQALYITMSGVDLDEEAVRLVQYQAAYQAAAKIIQVTDETLDTLMSLAR